MKTFVAIGIALLLSQLQVRAQTPQVGGASTNQSIPTSGFVTANGIKLHYLDWGGTGEHLLLLTGQGNDASVFESFAPKFTDRFHVIGLTRRGFGKSDRPRTGYDTDTLIEDIRQFVDALKMEKVALVGHSVAGTELTAFASKYPMRVSKLIYLDAGWNYTCKGGDEHPSWLPPPTGVPQPQVFLPSKALGDASDLYVPTYDKVQAPALAIYAPIDRHPEVPRGAAAERRKEMDAWWMRNGYACSVKSVDEFRDGMRQETIIVLPNGYHYLFLGSAQGEVVRHMREFLSGEAPR